MHRKKTKIHVFCSVQIRLLWLYFPRFGFETDGGGPDPPAAASERKPEQLFSFSIVLFVRCSVLKRIRTTYKTHKSWLWNTKEWRLPLTFWFCLDHSKSGSGPSLNPFFGLLMLQLQAGLYFLSWSVLSARCWFVLQLYVSQSDVWFPDEFMCLKTKSHSSNIQHLLHAERNAGCVFVSNLIKSQIIRWKTKTAL